MPTEPSTDTPGMIVAAAENSFSSAQVARRRLFLSISTTALGPVASLFLQIVNVPVYLRHWGPELYGEWLLLFTIPWYFAMSDLGFGTVAASDMTMRVARGDTKGAVEVFQSTLRLILLISFVILLLAIPLLTVVPIGRWMHLRILDPHQVKVIMVILTVDAVACLQTSLSIAGFRAAGLNHYAAIGSNAIRLVEGVLTLVAVMAGHGPLTVAIILIVTRALGNFGLAWLALRCVSWLRFGFSEATWGHVRILFRPAIAFLAFGAANSLALQGSVMIIGVVLGPIAVSIFAPMRTLSRVAIQVAEVLRNGAVPELSAAYGAGRIEFARKIHRLICQLSLVLSGSSALLMVLVGPWVMRIWTHGIIRMDLPTFYLLCADVVFASFWNSSFAVPVAANRHVRTTVLQLGLTTLCLAMSFPLLRWIGLAGAAAALLICDALMNFAILPVSLQLLGDHMRSFTSGILDVRPMAQYLRRRLP